MTIQKPALQGRHHGVWPSWRSSHGAGQVNGGDPNNAQVGPGPQSQVPVQLPLQFHPQGHRQCPGSQDLSLWTFSFGSLSLVVLWILTLDSKENDWAYEISLQEVIIMVWEPLPAAMLTIWMAAGMGKFKPRLT